MKIGDEVFVHGCVDEIRKDVVIIRNKGGYFGTVPSEVITGVMTKGKWIRGDVEKLTGKAKCSVCGVATYKSAHYFNFCPVCGARMAKGEEDEG